ncbi:cytochrome-c peroxidase [Kaarinaea lacus]
MALMQNLLTNCKAGGVLLVLYCLGFTFPQHALAIDESVQTHTQHHDIGINTNHSREPIRPIPGKKNLSLDKIALGEKLFNDKRLDSNQLIACGDCHNLSLGGTDQLAFSVNGAGKPTRFNTPSIFNVGLNTQYYWSGKFETLEEQLTDALVEINTTWPQLIHTITEIPEYVDQFKAIYTDGITKKNIKDALISFELSLVTPDSPFDLYLKGDVTALTAGELQGYRLFKSYGCVTCHQGVNMGGNFVLQLDKLGAPFGNLNSTRNRLQGKLRKIRVPSLRNVALTSPYFHDGSATTLHQAVSRMADEYLGIGVDEQQVSLIVDFLKTLTGKYKGQSL